MKPQDSCPICDLVVVGCNRSAVPEAVEVLRREEAESRGVTQGSPALLTDACPRGLRGVLQQLDAAFACKLLKLLHRGRPAEEMDRHDRACLGRQHMLDGRARDTEGFRVDVAKDRL